jgi:hypothetical protein
LLDVKLIIDLFLSFIESFTRLDREFDKPIFFSLVTILIPIANSHKSELKRRKNETW